jgi:hypothetical protein
MFESLAPTNCAYLLISFQCSATMHFELQTFSEEHKFANSLFFLMAVVESRSRYRLDDERSESCLRLATRGLGDIETVASFSLMFFHPSK